MISQIRKAFYHWINSEGNPNSLLLAMALGVASFGILLSFLAFQSPVFEPSPGKPMVAEIELYGAPSSLTSPAEPSPKGSAKPSNPAVQAEPTRPQTAAQAGKTPATASPVSTQANTKAASDVPPPIAKVAPPKEMLAGTKIGSQALTMVPKSSGQDQKSAVVEGKPSAPAKQTKPTQPSAVATKQINKATAAPLKAVQGPTTPAKPFAVEAGPVGQKPQAAGTRSTTAKPLGPADSKIKAASQPQAPKQLPKVSSVAAPTVLGGGVKSTQVPVQKAKAPVQVSTAPKAKLPSSNITFPMPPNQQAGSPLVPLGSGREVLEPVSIEPIGIEPLSQLDPGEANPERLCTRIRQVGQDGGSQATVVETIAMGNNDCMYP